MKLTRHELEVMDILWALGGGTVRQVLEAIPPAKRPAYTTVQTVINRLETKKALRRVGKEGNAHLFQPVVSRPRAHRRLIRELVSVVGSAQNLVSHLVESGELTLDDLRALEQELAERESR